ncbi:MAG: DUF4911 domain-containing protein [Desulfobacterales bacterium]|jgi:hypothetical protein|nr:DUF4911 domain-containing protein [Desulfobacteraceae bacterium]MDD3991519.1 DUF4911 domain-containing protein [Desulfobacteraceae bacterium]MDY0312190.1 DUF4911 domain-containing protein [Desulfobacterales bacterium]
MRTTIRHYRIERREIAYLRFLLEGYDGAALLTTRDAVRGVVQLRIAPGNLELVQALMAHLGREMRMEALTALDAATRGTDA